VGAFAFGSLAVVVHILYIWVGTVFLSFFVDKGIPWLRLRKQWLQMEAMEPARSGGRKLAEQLKVLIRPL